MQLGSCSWQPENCNVNKWYPARNFRMSTRKSPSLKIAAAAAIIRRQELHDRQFLTWLVFEFKVKILRVKSMHSDVSIFSTTAVSTKERGQLSPVLFCTTGCFNRFGMNFHLPLCFIFFEKISLYHQQKFRIASQADLPLSIRMESHRVNWPKVSFNSAKFLFKYQTEESSVKFSYPSWRCCHIHSFLPTSQHNLKWKYQAIRTHCKPRKYIMLCQ